MDETLRSLFPFVCILSGVMLAFTKPDTDKMQLALLTIGGTAYQASSKQDKKYVEDAKAEEDTDKISNNRGLS